MSKGGSSPNTPEPSEKHSDSPGHSLHHPNNNAQDSFLKDISQLKHIPEIAKSEQPAGTLFEMLFGTSPKRTINKSLSEFRVLDLNFINRSVYMGLSHPAGQSSFLTLFKGEIKDNLLQYHKESLSNLLSIIAQKKQNENFKTTKEDTKSSHKTDRIEQKISTSSIEEEDLLIEPILKEPNLGKQQRQAQKQTTDKRYDIINEIEKATEFELSNLLPEQSTLFKQLEQSQSHDLSSTSSSSRDTTLSIERLKECLSQFSKGKILVVGDLLIDELLEGRAERISREAPVLILEHVDTRLVPGGAANAAHNVTALGGQCHTVGICGDDEYAKKLEKLLDDHKITHDLIVDSSRPTTVKTRILSKTHALIQQLLRLDRISHDTIDNTITKRLVAKLEIVAKQYPLLILSDYRAGIINDEIIHACQKLATQHNLKIIVDAQDNFERFQNPCLITPNQPDTEKMVGYKINNETDLLQAGKDMLLLTGAQAVLITRGKDGMVLFEHGQKPFSLPAFNRSEIFDVSGAGDTVVATAALGLATGATMAEAITLGNVAASIVVKKPGTAVTNQEEILSTLTTIDWLVNKDNT